MEKKFFQLILFALVLMTATASTVFAAESVDEQRAELNEMREKVLDRMYEKYPETKLDVKKTYAYCTISASSVKMGFWGGDRGRGVAVNNDTSKKIYVKIRRIFDLY